MTPRSRVALALLAGLIVGVVGTFGIDFGYFIIPLGRPLGYDIGYVATWTVLLWLTLGVWFFIFLKWAQGKDLSNKLKMLEIHKLELQIHLTKQSHPELKELSEL